MDLSGSWEYIERIAKSRLAHNKTPRHSSDYGDVIEVLGVAGEVVARRFLGLKESTHQGFDDGTDLVFCGHTIDVKATRLTAKVEYRFLQWPLWKKVKAEVVLMTAVDPDKKIGTVLGYVYKHEIEAAPVNLERAQPCKEIPVRNLHPAWELFQMRQRSGV
jgi:hypothetical protein